MAVQKKEFGALASGEQAFLYTITNQKGELVATFESSVFRKGDALPFAVPL